MRRVSASGSPSSSGIWSIASLTMMPVVCSFSPGSAFFSTTVTASPARASAVAQARPAKLAPTTTQSAREDGSTSRSPQSPRTTPSRRGSAPPIQPSRRAHDRLHAARLASAPTSRAPLRRASAAAPRPQCRASSSVGPLRLPAFGSAIAACGSSFQSMHAEQRLHDIVDDRGAARGAPTTMYTRPLAVVDDGGRHRRARPLARLDAVRHGQPAFARHKREVGELVVEQEAAFGHEPAAEGRFDRRRHRDRVAVAVDDGDVRGRRQLDRGVRARHLAALRRRNARRTRVRGFASC